MVSQQVKKKPRFRKHKKVLVFDEKKRKEFLTGFRKRKEKRRKVAVEQLEQQLKDERKRIKTEIKDTIKNQFKKSFEPIPELEEVLNEDEYEDEDEDVTVKIIELSSKEISKQSYLIGDNCAESDNEEVMANNEEDIEESENEAIPGMNIKISSTDKKKSKLSIEVESLKTKSEVNRLVMKNVEKYMKNSKVFKTKIRMDAVKNRKKSRKENNLKRKKVDKYKGTKKTKTAESSGYGHTHGHGKGSQKSKKKH